MRKPHNTPTQQFSVGMQGQRVGGTRKPREYRAPRVTAERLDAIRLEHPDAIVQVAKLRNGLYRADMVTYYDPSRKK